ncbi:hypothetical protein A7J67_18355 [Achromobacter xylosoxidans]|nr:hypothetical protein A7J67_18355 [Achromobacter xylosoxidans]
MLHALWITGAVFAGLMGGLGFAATYDPVKWSDAVTAIGTVIAAIGTVGTLGYQVVQTAKAQRQLRTQALLAEHMEAELVQMWLLELRHLIDYYSMVFKSGRQMSDADLAVWKGELSSVRDKVKDGRARITSRLGHRFYLAIDDALGLANSLLNRASSRHHHDGPGDLMLRIHHLSAMLKDSLDQTTEWRKDLDLRIANGQQ